MTLWNAKECNTARTPPTMQSGPARSAATEWSERARPCAAVHRSVTTPGGSIMRGACCSTLHVRNRSRAAFRRQYSNSIRQLKGTPFREGPSGPVSADPPVSRSRGTRHKRGRNQGSPSGQLNGGGKPGAVALAEVSLWRSHSVGLVSDDEGQLGERVSEAGMERRLRPEVVEASAEVLDEGMPGDDDPGGAISLQPPHGPESSLEASVVGLDGIVGVDLRVVEGRREHLVDDPGVGPVPVGGDLGG